MYIRKTYDEYEIQGNYGRGRENEPQFPHRIVKKRIRKGA